MILSLFSSRSSHPLADARELKRRIGGLPLDNAFDALDQVSAWLKSLHPADDLPLDLFFDVLRQIDEAAQPHLQRLAREYLNSARASKNEEGRLWTSNHGYWAQVSDLYAQCIERFIDKPKDKASVALRGDLPLVSARLIAALATQLKWLAYRYSPVNPDLWADLGHAYLVADALEYAEKPLRLYPDRRMETTVAQQYLHALIREASSIDCLTPPEIESVDRLSEYFLPTFVLSAESRPDSVYWIDTASDQPPIRLALQAQEMSISTRFFSPGTAPQALEALMAKVQAGEIPVDLNLGRQSTAKQLLPVLKHLTRYWAPHPPLREHPRHPVKNRCAVLHGFKNCHATLGGVDGAAVDGANDSTASENWWVENVSFGGFGAEVDCARNDWPKLGALLCLQPDGGQNWVLAVVRRYSRRSTTQARVGIQSLSRQATSIELFPLKAGINTISPLSSTPAIWLGEGEASDEVRIVLPANGFNLQQDLRCAHDNKRSVLTPIALEESGSDYQIGRYREHSVIPA